jgi:hypothetical protein
MRRHVQLFHLAQARGGPLGRRINSKPPSEWPEHIKLAWTILRDELQVTEERASQLISDSISAARACAESVNRRSRNIVEAQSRAKVGFAFKRLANCCRRASAFLRGCLDEAIQPLLQQDPVDSEVIHDILDVTASEFEISAEGVALTAMRAMFKEPGSWRDDWLMNEYAGLRPETQRNCEVALSKLAQKKRSAKAHMVFEALAAGVKKKPAGNDDPDPATLRSNYVSALVRLWKAAGLRPARAYREGDSHYKSKFHRYSDLILTAVGEPWAQRHSGNLDHMRRRTYKAWAGMPREYKASAALPPSAAEWLISEHILRKGLGQRIQKQRR